jgi:hypothetical protein
VRHRLAALLILVAPLVVAGTASAATVSIRTEPEGQDEDPTGNLFYVAAPGEVNRLTVAVAGTTFAVTDPGAVIGAGPGCHAIDAHRATCTGDGEAVAELGDGDDTASGEAAADGGAGDDTLAVAGSEFVYSPHFTDGGPGDDTIFGGGPIAGGEGADRLISSATSGAAVLGYASDPRVDGGPGDDTVVGPQAEGGPGTDVVRGTAGPDLLSGGPGADLIDGGAGEDQVAYGYSATGVRVDLRHPEDAGGPSEHDRLVGIEDVDGGSHRDVLTGDAGPNVLDSGQAGGNDVVVGGRGDDTLWGGPNRIRGRTRLSGGPGADTLRVNLARDRYSCGAGRDAVDVPDEGFADEVGGIGRIPGDCERIASDLGSGVVLLGVPRRHAHRLASRMSGPACVGTITVRGPDRHGRPGRLWARTRWHRRARARAPHRLVLRLTRPGRRAARRHRLAVERLAWADRCRERRPLLSTYAWLARL